MAKPRQTFMPPPRLLTSPVQVAAILGRGEEWFRINRARLEAEGFPARDALLGGWDMAAINLWLDRRAGMAKQSTEQETANPWDRLLGGQGESAIC